MARTVYAPNPDRRALLAKVHVAAKQLGLSDDDYRATLEAVTGKRSAGDCSVAELASVLNHFVDRGWLPKPNAERKPKAPRRTGQMYEIPPGTAHETQKRYILALANALGWSLKGLDTRCARQFGVDKLLWLKSEHALQKLGRDLVNRCRKRGIETEPNHPDFGKVVRG